MPSTMGPELEHLLSLQAVRERAQVVLREAEQGRLNNFIYHPERLPAAADFVIGVINRDFGPDKFDTIPPHGRWQHLEVGGVPRVVQLLDRLAAEGCDKLEQTRRLVDLFFVSVLLDAGAGDVWKFEEPGTSESYTRSEGIGVASLYMFTSGAFSGDGKTSIVDAKGLCALTDEMFQNHFQITPENPIIGVSSRVSLMNSIGEALKNEPELAGPDGRPGNIVDYLIKSAPQTGSLDFALLWSTLQRILIPAWPKNRTNIDGHYLGDAWPLQVLATASAAAGHASIAAGVQPFHKLTQWLAYSLTVPLMRVLDMKIHRDNLGTGLPEYRNGGLLVDMGVLELKPQVLETGRSASGQELPMYGATSDTIVEWRAMTVALLDELYKLVAKHFAEKGFEMSMAQVLEAGTWKGGRELAAKYRPKTKSSPILMDGDGTLF